MQDRKDINILVGANIKRERERAGLTQETFSEMIGLGPKSVSAIERGTVGVSLATLKKMLLCGKMKFLTWRKNYSALMVMTIRVLMTFWLKLALHEARFIIILKAKKTFLML